METIYLKAVSPFTGENKITRVIAINGLKEIIFKNGQIDFTTDQDGYMGEKWYREHWKAVESTKAEFDAFYIKTVNELNDLIKEL
jgi:hypothetical protein